MAGLLQMAFDFLSGGGGGDAAATPGGEPRARAPALPPASRPPRSTPPRISRPRKDLRADDPPVLDPADAGLPVHPRANREALLDGRRIGYAFQRSRRRTIGFSVGAEGLTVRAPGWVSLHEIDAALAEKAAWILRKLAEAGARRGQQEESRVVWGDGARFPYLGRMATVRLVPPQPGVRALRRTTAVWREAEVSAEGVETGPWLELALSPAVADGAEAAADAVREAVRGWLQQQARGIFTERLDHFAPLLGVNWTRLTLTSARTRWGSAGHDGGIRLHWRLLHFRLPVVDYVVAHELAHLRHMNHSPRFWATVATVVPDHLALRAELRADTTPKW